MTHATETIHERAKLNGGGPSRAPSRVPAHRTAPYLDPDRLAGRSRPRTVVALSYDEVRTLRKALSTEDSRPLLQRVHVRPDVVETTNGHILFRVPSRTFQVGPDGEPTGETGSVFGPVDFPRMTFPGDVLKGLRAKQCLTVDTSDGTLTVHEDPDRCGRPGDVIAELGDRAVQDGHPDVGSYPRTDQVVPDYITGGREWRGVPGPNRAGPREGDYFRIAFNGDYLKRLGDAAKYLSPGRGGPARVIMTVVAPERAAYVELPGDAYGLVMPLRVLD